MDSDRRMRCSMSVSKPKSSFLAMEEAVRYSSVHGERHRDRVSTNGAVWDLFCGDDRLRRDDRAGVAEAGHGRHEIYTVGARGQDCLCGGIVQRLGQGSDANETSGR